jgi:hypothetical protein
MNQNDDDFIRWVNSDNVISLIKNEYQTQCTQYSKSFTIDTLKFILLKNIVNKLDYVILIFYICIQLINHYYENSVTKRKVKDKTKVFKDNRKERDSKKKPLYVLAKI